MKKFLSIIIIYSVFYSCKHDLENPTWDVDMIVPIANAEININDIVEMGNNQVNTNYTDENLVSLVYTNNILTSEYDSLLNIFSTSDKKKFRIDSVQFDDVEIEYNTTIGSVINQLGPLGSAIYPDGSMREIPIYQA